MPLSAIVACPLEWYNSNKNMSVLLFYCTYEGQVLYADPTYRRWSPTPLEGQHFLGLLAFEDDHKGEHFLEATRAAHPLDPTLPWELIIGTPTYYTIATFRGYSLDNHIFIAGCTQHDEIKAMQQEMEDLTSDLAEAQREVRRQNRALQQSLYDQHQLVRRLMAMAAPAIPIWDVSLVISLLNTASDEQHKRLILKELWHRSGMSGAHYVILDLSSTQSASKDMIEQLLIITRLLGKSGIEPLVIDAGSGIIQAIHSSVSNIDTHNLKLFRDIYHAIGYISSQEEALDRETEE